MIVNSETKSWFVQLMFCWLIFLNRLFRKMKINYYSRCNKSSKLEKLLFILSLYGVLHSIDCVRHSISVIQIDTRKVTINLLVKLVQFFNVMPFCQYVLDIIVVLSLKIYIWIQLINNNTELVFALDCQKLILTSNDDL